MEYLKNISSLLFLFDITNFGRIKSKSNNKYQFQKSSLWSNKFNLKLITFSYLILLLTISKITFKFKFQFLFLSLTFSDFQVER